MKSIFLLPAMICMTAFAQENNNLAANAKMHELLTGSKAPLHNDPSANSNTDTPNPDPAVFNCSTVFWTVDDFTAVREWNLIGNTVTGGNTVATGCGPSLSYHGSASQNFYTTAANGIYKHNGGGNWTNQYSYNSLLSNNGGYRADSFYMGVDDIGFFNRIYHFDETALTVAGQIPYNNSFSVADIAVDSMGRAWVFVGDDITNTVSVNVYDKNGLVTTYPVSFMMDYLYGSFFLEDKLYVGSGSAQSIYPIVFDSGVAVLGAPIPFPVHNYLDMASCNSSIPLSTKLPESANAFTVWPNPASNDIHVTVDAKITAMKVYNIQGIEVRSQESGNELNIADLATGIYLLKISTEVKTYSQLIVKK